MPVRVAKTMWKFSSQVFVDDVRSGAGFLRLDADGGGDFFVAAQFEEVGNGTALRGAAHLGNFVNLLHVGAP